MVESRKKQAALREARERELTASGAGANAVQREVRKIVVRPRPGDVRLDRPALKPPDLGNSFIQSRPVWPIIAQALPTTLLLEATSLPPALAIAVLSGIWAAKNRGKAQDVVTGTVLLALYSIPVMWVGVLMVGFAYLWKRGDLQWVKSLSSDAASPLRSVQKPAGQLAGSGS